MVAYISKGGGGAEPIGISDIFYIALKSSNDVALLRRLAAQKNASIEYELDFLPLWYRLKLDSGSTASSLQVCNELYETGHFADVDPAFMFNFRPNCVNDPKFGDLWGLKNTQNPAIDINACEAWQVSEGSGVTVAVVDKGVYKGHNDLKNNISALSFDALSETSPSKYIDQHHGTNVAGVIAAEKDNDLQVVGVAPQADIMVVSHPLSGINATEELAAGIRWAWKNGADVINCSWGDQGGIAGYLHSKSLDKAIADALEKGRNGLGTVVVFAAGNMGQWRVMDYPANSNEDILAVGAIDRTGKKAPFSGYGKSLDVVAPGVDILTTDSTNFISSFGGTSAAAPHAAGIAALILSVAPSLTAREVNDIIESTAQKVGGYPYAGNADRSNGTWNEEMGYGLVDANAAVRKAFCIAPNITMTQAGSWCARDGSIVACMKINKNLANCPVTWAVSSGAKITSSNNTSVRVRWSSTIGNTLQVTAKMGSFSLTGTASLTGEWSPAGKVVLTRSNNGLIYENAWNTINAYYNGTVDRGTSGYTWHWSSGGVWMRGNGSSVSSIRVMPRSSNTTSTYIQVRASDKCGRHGTWTGDWFMVISAPSGNTGGPTPSGGIP